MSDCQCDSRGLIHLILGPMFSGKTTELFRLTKRYSLAGKRVVVVKYSKDNRYDLSHACTHDLNKMEAIAALNIGDVMEQIDSFDVVGIDEGQFFQDVVQCAEDLANSGKVVIIAALNGDYQQKPFQNITSLFSMAEKIEKLSAVCRSCGHSASFTFRTLQSTEREVIGGEDIYQAICRHCLLSHHEKQLGLSSSDEELAGEVKLNNGGASKMNGGHAVQKGTPSPVEMDGRATA